MRILKRKLTRPLLLKPIPVSLHEHTQEFIKGSILDKQRRENSHIIISRAAAMRQYLGVDSDQLLAVAKCHRLFDSCCADMLQLQHELKRLRYRCFSDVVVSLSSNLPCFVCIFFDGIQKPVAELFRRAQPKHFYSSDTVQSAIDFINGKISEDDTTATSGKSTAFHWLEEGILGMYLKVLWSNRSACSMLWRIHSFESFDQFNISLSFVFFNERKRYKYTEECAINSL